MGQHNPPESIYKEYKERYGDILQTFSPDTFVIWVLDAQSRNFYCNNMEILQLGKGLPPSASLDDWIDLVHPEDISRIGYGWLTKMQSAEQGNAMEGFYRVRREDGSYLWILSKGAVVNRNAQGVALYAAGIFIPVHALEEKLEACVTRQERAGFALDAARDGLWDWNLETGEVYYSPRYIAMMGYTPEEFAQTRDAWRSRVHKDDLEKTVLGQLVYINSPERGDLFESIYRFLDADGFYRWILNRAKVVQRGKNGRAKRIVGLHTDVTDLLIAQENLTRLVQHDALTRLSSRLYFDQAFARLSENDYPVSIMYVDVDLLKAINDSLGHDAGDKLLVTAADILRSVVRSTDVIARLGGDEFALLMPHCSSRAANRILGEVTEVLRQRNSNPENMPVFLSMGVACTDTGIKLRDLMREADQAMFYQKRQNRAESRAHMTDWINRRQQHGCRKEDVKI